MDGMGGEAGEIKEDTLHLHVLRKTSKYSNSRKMKLKLLPVTYISQN